MPSRVWECEPKLPNLDIYWLFGCAVLFLFRGVLIRFSTLFLLFLRGDSLNEIGDRLFPLKIPQRF